MSEVINLVDTTQLTFIFLLVLAFTNIFLAYKPRIPLLNFVVGLFTFGMVATTIGNTEMLFNGYVQIFTLFMAVIGMLSATKEVI